MRAVAGFCATLLATTALCGQNQTGFVNAPNVTRTFGSVVYPGSSAALPGVQRTVGSVVHPAGGTAQIAVPGLAVQGLPLANGGRGLHRNGPGAGAYAYPVAVPVYVGSYDMMAPQQAPPPIQQQQPNVIVVYPPAPPYPTYPTYSYQQPPAQSNYIEAPASSQDQAAVEPTHYMLAFKDHSIYSAVAYWVDGDTLHYFTSGNTHNQASLSLLDRDLTKRLNEGSGLEVKLPAAK